MKLLNSFSSEIAYKILNLYMVKGGLNLTETAREIREKTSTVRDHLNRLTKTQLISVSKEVIFF
ncbi:MAG: winged helix-turn-helix transcriptional regulator [Promethearchaeota archaeon]